MPTRDTTYIRYTARALSVAWALWWIFFGLACGVFNCRDLGDVLVHGALPGLFFLLTAVFAWKWEYPGGAALVAEGITAFGIYLLYFRYFSLSVLFLALLTMSAPAIIAGGLFMTTRKKKICK